MRAALPAPRFDPLLLDGLAEGYAGDTGAREHAAGLRFDGVDLTGADLSGADLTTWVDFPDRTYGSEPVSGEPVTHPGTDLTGADLTHANLSGTDLTDADLTDASLTDVFYDEDTTWPNGFDPPPSAPPPWSRSDHHARAPSERTT